MALRSVADIEEQIKKRHERDAKHVAKIAEQSGLLVRDISDEDLVKEFAAIAARFPQKA
ncbi:TraC-like protein [Ochrobactrum sp. BH3]|uniref:hypothetical protein n=1 Tax=Brucella pituitosa TaxID=571256 RepID=UPI001047B460|nr:hypothetical protein [Brucella pituitosa]TCQ73042.1 TraC-like protein [Ochrobactrum sp. BH3]